jgi:hypothetical protein
MNFLKVLLGKATSKSKSSGCCGVEIKELKESQEESCCDSSTKQKSSCC